MKVNSFPSSDIRVSFLFCSGLVYLAWLGKGVFATIARSGVLRFFGRYSYGLYVFHGLLIPLLFPLLPSIQRRVKPAELGGLFFVALALALSVILALLGRRLFEDPILRLKSRFV